MRREPASGRQNIRYYEKQGLLHPERNLENDYRVYGEAEISRLNEIKLFRKLGISIEEIRRMLDGELELGTVLEMQKEKLRARRKHSWKERSDFVNGSGRESWISSRRNSIWKR